jgi:hypothetical protein
VPDIRQLYAMIGSCLERKEITCLGDDLVLLDPKNIFAY